MFLYSIKNIVRKKEDMFWRIVFPLVLMVLFYFCFGNITSIENNISTMRIGFCSIGEGQYQQSFESMLNELDGAGDDSEDMLSIDLVCCDRDEMQDSLNSGELDAAYVVSDDKVEVLLGQDYDKVTGMIVREVADRFDIRYSIIEEVAKRDSSKIQDAIDNVASETKEYLIVDQSESGKDSYMWYFISTIVMGIMFNFMCGISIVGLLRADATMAAVRVAVSPESRMRLVVREFLAALVVTCATSLFQLLVVRFAFGYHIFDKVVLMLVAVVLSNAFSIGFGILLGFIFKGTLDQRGNKAVGIIMCMEFLSGEMIATLPGLIEQKMPIINDISPSMIIKLIFYRLIAWDDIGDLYVNFVKLFVATIVLIVIAVMILRRETYESV